MKQILAAMLFTFILIGCDNSNPSDANVNSEAMYGEETMYKTTISTYSEISLMQGNGPGHDSIRHGRMLGHLKTYVGLTDVQFDSVKVYAQTLFLSLKDIHKQYHDSLITREEARELVKTARGQFVISVKSILTEEQSAKFDVWVERFWNKPPHRGGHGKPGGRGHGNGGPGGRP